MPLNLGELTSEARRSSDRGDKEHDMQRNGLKG